jgi:UDP-N-acetylglucosamine 2-epimerase (non-hydrolysing)
MKLMLIFGTRPELIKLAPLIRMAKKDPNFELITCSTGQHREMLDQALNAFSIKPDIDLGVMAIDQSLESLTSKLVLELSKCLEQFRPDVVLVQGDTTSAFIGALAAFYKKIPVAHVEAGLRTGDLQSPFPEELNRTLISCIANWHFAPTRRAKENLLSEGVPKHNIYVTGNTVVDALEILAKSNGDLVGLKENSSIVPEQDFVLVTVHRRENHGSGITSICQAIKNIAKDYPSLQFIFPIHLNPNIRQIVISEFQGYPQVILLEPVDFQTMLYLESSAKLIITDSGGIQEEAPTFGTPVVITRRNTERVEGLNTGFSALAGQNSIDIESTVRVLLDDGARKKDLLMRSNPFGDGQASKRIMAALAGKLFDEFDG